MTQPAPQQGDKKKKGRVQAEVDSEILEAAKEKARRKGWSMKQVIESLLKLWVQEDVVTPEDAGDALPPPKTKKKK